MMKKLLVLLLLLSCSLAAGGAESLDPLDAIDADGSLTLSDGSSFFVFSRDRTFESFPNGMSGRTLKGNWMCNPSEPLIFTVEAEQSWMNGLSRRGDYRKIVFAIYPGSGRPLEHSSFGQRLPPNKIWTGYFIIEKMVEIPKPTAWFLPPTPPTSLSGPTTPLLPALAPVLQSPVSLSTDIALFPPH